MIAPATAGVTAAPLPRRRVAVESEALLAGAVTAALTGVIAAFIFAGAVWPLWGGFSVGIVAAIAVLVMGLTAGATGYWRSRNLPGQEWRHGLKPWKFTVDVIAVSAVHAIIAFILTMTTFVLLQRSFEGLVVDVWTSIGAIAVATGLASYWIYLSVSAISTPKLAMLLIVFMSTATLASMATAQDPQWWEYHFSQLGAADDFSSSLFNLALVVGGAFVTTFALYVDRDLTTLVRQEVLEHEWAPRFVSVVFIVMGILLAGVGLFPVNVNVAVHNSCAIGMSLTFLTLLIGSPRILRGMPRRFFVFCTGGIVLLLGSALLFEPIAYYNLTAFELAAFSIIFGWISVFIRFVSALTVNGPSARDTEISGA
ncbi:DUF998 domain-containing protein [Agromyces sp. Soil535]|uniref:DUF998 domain-containing protein n=1 Tax=Agromyces sp. Soil535 TaxID=1736390 RepID=UPI0006F4AB93|nr:DUF998 domain-containing protein [Agromyces sp. Soil535]KRE31181.1 hypothetical protein ASG80_01565 [Agromyces sp. Soil535]